MDEQLSPLVFDKDDARERSLAGDLRQLIDDGRALAEAELAYQKSRAVLAGKGARGIAVFGALAAALVFFALMALTLGLVIALAPLLSPLGAAGAVFAGFLLVAFVCARIAAARWKRMAKALADREASK